MHIVCPHCQNPIEVVHLTSHEEIACPSCGSSFRLESESTTGWNRFAGQKVGRFELIAVLGQGAFGTVYKARDPQLDRIVALKVPRAGNLAGPQDLDRFLREARSSAQLRHPSIVSVHEVGQIDAIPYLVTDFVEGVTLCDLLSSRRPAPTEAARLIADIAEALQYAHDRGVVHRDVKPSNVMLDGQGRPHVTDFGLAKREAGEITMTIEGQVLGTPAYMSPEQARGEAHRVDGRSDIYSLGVILYQILTGEMPFRGTHRMLLYQVLNDEPRPPRRLNDRLPRDLETICLKAMAKDPSRRYQTAAELAADLRRFLVGEPIKARPVSRRERVWRWCRRNPTVAVLTSFVAFLLIAGAIAGTGFAFYYAAAGKDLAAARDQSRTDATAALKAQKEAEDALSAKNAALQEKDGALQQAAKNADLAQQRLGQFFVDRGVGLLPTDPTGANLYFDEALRWDHVNQERAELHRFRLSAFLQHQQPRLVHHWSLDHPIDQVTFSPDGRRVLVRSHLQGDSKFNISAAGSARVWDRVTGKPLTPVMKHTDRVAAARFLLEGRRVITYGYDHGFRIWDAGTGAPLTPLLPNLLPEFLTNYHPLRPKEDGRIIQWVPAEPPAEGATGVRVWDAETGRPLTPILKTDGRPYRTILCPGLPRLLTVAQERHIHTVRLWNLETLQPIPLDLPPMELAEYRRIEVHIGPSGNRFLTLIESEDQQRHQVRVWDTRTGQSLGPVLSGEGGSFSSAYFDRDEKRILTIGGREITLRDIVTGKLVRPPFRYKFDGPTSLGMAGHMPGMDITISEKESRKPVHHLWCNEDLGAFTELSPTAQLHTLSQERGVLVDTDGTAQLLDLIEAKTVGEKVKVPAEVSSVQTSRPGRMLFRYKDKSIQLWNTSPTLHPEGAIVRPATLVDSSTFSPDGQSLMTLDEHDSIRLWKAGADGLSQVKTLDPGPGHRDIGRAGRSTRFSPTGKYFVAGNSGGTRLWEMPEGRPLSLLNGSSLKNAFFATDETAVVTGTTSGDIYFWDLTASEPALPGGLPPDVTVLASRVLSDGKQGRILVERQGAEWQILDAVTSAVVSRFEKPFAWITHSEFSIDGRRLLVVGGNGRRPSYGNEYGEEVRVWEVATGKELASSVKPGARHDQAILSPDGQSVLTTSGDEYLTRWLRNSGSSRVPAQLPGGVRDIRFGPISHQRFGAPQHTILEGREGGVRLLGEMYQPLMVLSSGEKLVDVVDLRDEFYQCAITVQDERTVQVWDPVTGQSVGHPLLHDRPIVAAHVISNMVVTVDEGGTLRRWNALSGKDVLPPRALGRPRQVLIMEPGSWLLLVDEQGRGRVLPTYVPDTPGVLDTLLPFDSPVTSASFYSDGKMLYRLVTAHADGTAQIWDLMKGKSVSQPLKHDGPITTVLVNAKVVVTGARDATARMWDTRTGELLGEPLKHDGPVEDVSFMSIDKLLTRTRTEVRLWTLATGKPVGVPMRPEGPVHQARLLDPNAIHGIPLSVLIASGKQAQVWDAATGRTLHQPMKHEQDVVLLEKPGASGMLLRGPEFHTATRNGAVQRWSLTGIPIGKPRQLSGRVLGFPIGTPFRSRTALIVRGDELRLVEVDPLGRYEPILPALKPGGRILQVVAGMSAGDGRPSYLNRLVTVSDDGSARLWRASLGISIGEPFRHDGPITQVGYVPLMRRVQPGTYLVPSGSVVMTVGGSQVRFWDAESGASRALPLSHPAEVRQATLLNIAPGGFPGSTEALLLTVSGKEVRLWNPATAAAIGPPLRHEVDIVHACAANNVVLTVGKNGAARTWDGISGRALGKELRHADPILFGSLDARGERALTFGAGEARRWDAITGEPLGPSEKYGPVPDPKFTVAENMVLLTGSDGSARTWDWLRSRVTPADWSLQRPELLATSVMAHFSQDGERIITTASDQVVQLWDTATGKPASEPLAIVGKMTQRSVTSPDGRSLALWSGSVVRFLDIVSGKELPLRMEHTTEIVQRYLRGTSAALLTSGTGHPLQGVVLAHVAAPPLWRIPTEHGQVYAVTFCPNGRHVISAAGTGYSTGSLLRGDLTTGAVSELQFKIPRESVQALGVSPDGTRLAILSGYLSGTSLQLYDLSTESLIFGPVTVSDRVEGSSSHWVRFSPDGRSLLISAGAVARVWDAATGHPRTPPLPGGHRADCFSADCRRLLTVSRLEARLWDAATGQPLAPPFPHSEFIVQATLSPDGRRVILTGRQQVRVWEIVSEERSMEALSLMAKIQAGRTLDASFNFVTLDTKQIREAWESILATGPNPFVRSTEDILGWHRRQVSVAERDGNWTAALTHLNRLIEAEPKEWQWQARRGRAYLNLGQPQQTQADYDRALAFARAETLAWLDAEARKNESVAARDQALFHLDLLLTVRPTDGALLLRRATIHIAMQNWERVGADLDRALAADPAMIRTRLRELADSADHARDMPRYLFYLDRLVAADPDDGRWLLRRAHVHIALKNDEQADRDFRKAFALNKDEALADHERQIQQLVSQRKWPQVIACLDRMIAAEPKRGKHYDGRAWAYFESHQWEKSAADYTRAIDLDFASELDTRAWVLWYNRGIASANLGEWEKASADFARAAEWKQAPVDTLLDQARVRLQLGDMKGYRLACAGLLERYGKTDLAEQANTVAWACALAPHAVTDYARPLELARLAVDRSPKNYACLNTLGTLLYRAGQDDKAIEQLNEGIKAHGKGGTPPDWLILAPAHQRLGHTAEARTWLNKVITELGPKEKEQTMSWSDRIELGQMRREAEERVRPAP